MTEHEHPQWCFSDFDKEGEKMNKKLLTIAIVLVILAMLVIPASATLPAKSPLPAGKPYELIWTFLNDLQTQINGISLTPGPVGPMGPQGVPGPKGDTGAAGTSGSNFETFIGVVDGDTLMDIPSGYTKEQCKIFVSPGSYNCNPDPSKTPFGTATIQYCHGEISGNQFYIHNDVTCIPPVANPIGQGWTVQGTTNYLIICQF